MANDSKDKWKNKYYNSLDDLEKMENEWAELASQISKSIVRLSMATEGHNPDLDRYLINVRSTLKDGEINAEVVERMDRLTTAMIRTHDELTKPGSESDKVDDQQQLDLFNRLLDSIPPPATKKNRVKVLRTKMEGSNSKSRMAAVKEILLIYCEEYKNLPIDA